MLCSFTRNSSWNIKPIYTNYILTNLMFRSYHFLFNNYINNNNEITVKTHG